MPQQTFLLAIVASPRALAHAWLVSPATVVLDQMKLLMGPVTRPGVKEGPARIQQI